MLKAHQISFAYRNGKTIEFPDIEIHSGSEWLILGPSGCGKTTLLHLLAGLIKPLSGSVRVNETDYQKLNSAQLDRFRGKNIGIVFQQAHFIQSLNIVQNLLLAMKLSGQKGDKKRCLAILDELRIADKAHRRPSELSTGEQQRAGIARAVVTNPHFILADEPTSALDDKNTDAVLDLLRQQAEKTGAALLIVTHDNRLKTRIKNTIEL
jgi:putative ABC transport system ATP-binding protein